jgi:hypothetical protein
LPQAPSIHTSPLSGNSACAFLRNSIQQEHPK